jgi:hypothetical protein
VATNIADEPVQVPPEIFGDTYDFAQVFHAEIALINQRRARAHGGGSTLDIEIEEIDVDVDEKTGEATVHIEEQRGSITLGAEDRPSRHEITLEVEGEDVTGAQVWRPNEDANVVGLALSGGGIRSAAFCLGVLQALDKAEVLDKVDYMSTVSGGGYIGCSLTAALESTGARGAPEFPFASRLAEDEPPALQQIRNYSNYLFPHGLVDVLHNVAIYTRGLMVNVALVAPILLAAAAITLSYYAVRRAEGWVSWIIDWVFNPFGLKHFFVTLELALLLVAVGVIWGIVQSLPRFASPTEIPDQWTRRVGILIIVFFAVLFSELQPFILDEMIGEGTGNLAVVATHWINTVTAVLAPVGVAMAFFANKLGEYVKSAMQSSARGSTIGAVALKVAIFVGGLILPVAILMIYLDVTYWGLCIDVPNCTCNPPEWLAIASYGSFGWSAYPATWLYAVAAVLLFPLSLIFQPNANSLHPLYRDRLRKAFLFVPQPQLDQDDLPVFEKPLSKISGLHGPYHLVNAALNIEDSETNRRGRNADFFVFSPLFVGSKSTDYVATSDVEKVAVHFDLATAMAVSGAAVSSEMGSQNIRALTATLALLNVRLGYWLRNPKKLKEAKPSDTPVRNRVSEYRRRTNPFANFYFIAEVFGLLTEDRRSIYLTDGGHIENLGAYELLRRRCRVIIVVDVEADPQMAFGSFNALERYALIDLGIRIDLPWQKITNESLKIGDSLDTTGDSPKDHGPHCAIGEISYPDDRKGVLVYIKASLTGDENDIVIDYKKRYNAFPHETTLDQLFTEEQFEAYRALGFHAAYGLFDRSDAFAHLDATKNPSVRPAIELLDQLFPLRNGMPPGPKQTLAAWLPASRARRRPAAEQ